VKHTWQENTFRK